MKPVKRVKAAKPVMAWMRVEDGEISLSFPPSTTMSQSIKDRKLLSKHYNHNPDHYTFPRTVRGYYPDDDKTPDWIAPLVGGCIVIIFSILYAIGVNL